LAQTAEMMTSADYKQRFRAEYFQLAIRLDKLEALLERLRLGELDFELNCSPQLLRHQRNSMRAYLRDLQKRAEIEEIEL
jgi:hypothetical protein